MNIGVGQSPSLTSLLKTRQKKKKTCVFRSEDVIECSVWASNRRKLLWFCFWVSF